MINKMNIEKLKKISKESRIAILKLGIEINSPHIGPAYSIVEIITLIYEDILTPNDKFILSKGHGCLALYNALHLKGKNPRLSGHPDIQIEEGIECTSGSLGHGLPISVGMAMGKKIKNESGKIIVLMGDGECQEGTIWESLLIASQNQLNNLIVVIDKNRLQALDFVSNISSLGNLKQKFESFGFFVIEVNGHDFEELKEAFTIQSDGLPKIIVANTIKGKGLKTMENNPIWHARLPQNEELEEALEGLR